MKQIAEISADPDKCNALLKPEHLGDDIAAHMAAWPHQNAAAPRMQFVQLSSGEPQVNLRRSPVSHRKPCPCMEAIMTTLQNSTRNVQWCQLVEMKWWKLS